MKTLILIMTLLTGCGSAYYNTPIISNAHYQSMYNNRYHNPQKFNYNETLHNIRTERKLNEIKQDITILNKRTSNKLITW